MSRVINPDNAQKIRNQNMRLGAEILAQLVKKAEIDDEAKDMLATLVLAFREIEDGVEESMIAWEKRNYWNKVEQFRAQWIWVGAMSAKLEQQIREQSWESLPMTLVSLMPRFADITITKFTRKSDAWEGNYRKLMAEPAKSIG